MLTDYQYPMAFDWSTQEIIDTVTFFECVEKAYETGVKREELMNAYRRYKEIVPSKWEEKALDKEFQEVSGYSTYRVVAKAKELAEGTVIKM